MFMHNWLIAGRRSLPSHWLSDAVGVCANTLLHREFHLPRQSLCGLRSGLPIMHLTRHSSSGNGSLARKPTNTTAPMSSQRSAAKTVQAARLPLSGLAWAAPISSFCGK